MKDTTGRPTMKKTAVGPTLKLPETFEALTAEQLAAFTKLRPILQRFIIEYLVDQNATQAAARAGYSKKTARVLGQRQLINVAFLIKPLLDAQSRHLAVKSGITRERWLEEVQRLAFYDPRKFFDDSGNAIDIPSLSEEAAAVVAGFEVTEEYSGKGQSREKVGYTKKFKLADKLAALVIFGKATGHYSDEPIKPLSPIEGATVRTLLAMEKIAEEKLASMRPPKKEIAYVGNGGH